MQFDCFMLLAGFVFLFIAGKLSDGRPTIRAIGIKAGIVVGITAGIYALFIKPADGLELTGVLLFAACCGLVTSATLWIVLTGLFILFYPLLMGYLRLSSWRRARTFSRIFAENERATQERIERRRREEQERIANQPPPPNREQRIADARQRHQQTIRELEEVLTGYELEGAKQKEKQRFLKELDGLL